MHKQNHATQSVLTHSILKQSIIKQNMLKQYEVWGTFIAISGVGHLCLLFFLFFLSGSPTTHVSLLVNKRLSGKQVDVLLANAYSRRGNKSRVNNGARTGARNSGVARNSSAKNSVKTGSTKTPAQNHVSVKKAEPAAEPVKKTAHKTTLGSRTEKKNKTDNSKKLNTKKENAQQSAAKKKRERELEQKKGRAKKVEAKKAEEKKIANKKSEKNNVEKKKELEKKTEQKKEVAPEQKVEKVPEPVTPVSEPAAPALEQGSAQPATNSLLNTALGLLGLDQPVGADQVTDLVNQDNSMPVMIEEDAQDIESLLRYVALQKECSRCWRPPVGVDKACVCSIQIYVNEQGKVHAIEMVEKSGVLMFDSAAKMTVYAMELPKWAYNKSLVITFKQE